MSVSERTWGMQLDIKKERWREVQNQSVTPNRRWKFSTQISASSLPYTPLDKCAVAHRCRWMANSFLFQHFDAVSQQGAFAASSPLGFCRRSTTIIPLLEKWVFSAPSTCWSGFCSKIHVVWFDRDGVNWRKVTSLWCGQTPVGPGQSHTVAFSFSLSKVTHLRLLN